MGAYLECANEDDDWSEGLLAYAASRSRGGPTAAYDARRPTPVQAGSDAGPGKKKKKKKKKKRG
jgi:hypothetical protein